MNAGAHLRGQRSQKSPAAGATGVSRLMWVLGRNLGSYLQNSNNMCSKLQIPSSGAGCPIAETDLEFLNHLPLPPKCWIIGTCHDARL